MNRINYFILTKYIVFILLVSINYAENKDYVKINVNSKWEFQCPHVSDVGGYKKIVVTWLLDEAIWLKIDNGTAAIINRLITFNRRQLGSSNVYTIVLNDFRYRYYYDEATGDFSMTIQDAREDDSGMWECQIELHKKNGEVEDLKTDAYVLVGNVKPKTTKIQEQSSLQTALEGIDEGDKQTTLMYNIEEAVLDEETSKSNGNNTANIHLSFLRCTSRPYVVVVISIVMLFVYKYY